MDRFRKLASIHLRTLVEEAFDEGDTYRHVERLTGAEVTMNARFPWSIVAPGWEATYSFHDGEYTAITLVISRGISFSDEEIKTVFNACHIVKTHLKGNFQLTFQKEKVGFKHVIVANFYLRG